MRSEPGGKTYRPWEPQRYRQEAHSPAAKLPEGDGVFFLLDIVPQLDLQRFYAPYEEETRGGQARPDFRTLSDCRKLHLEAFKDVCAGDPSGRGGGVGEMRQRVDGWHENPGQGVASQGDELWVYEEGSRALARGH